MDTYNRGEIKQQKKGPTDAWTNSGHPTHRRVEQRSEALLTLYHQNARHMASGSARPLFCVIHEVDFDMKVESTTMRQPTRSNGSPSTSTLDNQPMLVKPAPSKANLGVNG